MDLIVEYMCMSYARCHSSSMKLYSSIYLMRLKDSIHKIDPDFCMERAHSRSANVW